MLGALALAMLVACGVEVTNPDVLTPGSLGGKDALPTLLAGAVGDFAIAYGGRAGVFGTEQGWAILIGGLLGDELGNTAQVSDWTLIDRRVVTAFNGEDQTLYRNLHRARAAAERAAGRYRDLDPAAFGYAHALDLAGYTYIFFGEMYCGGVPFSSTDDQGAIAYGAPLTTAQILAQAITRFDSVLDVAPSLAAAHPGAADSVLAVADLARIGKARSLLDLGEYAEAANVASPVPTGFVAEIEYGTNSDREKNAVYHFNHVDRSYNVSDGEGANGLPYASAGDPRTPVEANGQGVDLTVPFYLELAYPAYDSPIPLGTGVEARLIEAEALLQSGDPTGALARLDALRAAAGMPPVQDPGTPNGRVDLLFRERASWLWLTAHRLGDLRRLVRNYGRGPETVYPTGAYAKNQETYGTDLSLPVSVDELVNPRYTASACSTTIP